ncbi:MAG: hypothetical protein AAF413_01365 [Patescibacteria group bacterium]
MKTKLINLVNKFKNILSVLVLVGLIGSTVAAVNAQAPDVVFNNATGVSGGVGNEADFLRINNATGGNTIEACEDGQTVNLWFYVHNTNPSFVNGNNYDGAGVAHNTRVDLDFLNNGGFTDSKTIRGTVKADNSATATDTVSVTCGSDDIKLEYVSQSMAHNAPAWNSPFALTGNIMNSATLGYDGGLVPGCWEYRAYITVTVKVVVEEPEPEAYAVCTSLLTPSTVNRTNVDLEVTRPVEGQHFGNTTVTGYEFLIFRGNEVVKSKRTNGINATKATITDLVPGTYTAKVHIFTADGTAQAAAACAKQFTIEAVNLTHTCNLVDITVVDKNKFNIEVNYTAKGTPANSANVKLVSSVIRVTGPEGFSKSVNSTEYNNLMLPEVAGTYKITADLTFETTVDGAKNTVVIKGAENTNCMNTITINAPQEPPKKCEDADAINTGSVGECRYEVCRDSAALNNGERGGCEYETCEDDAASNTGKRGECQYNNVPVGVTTTPRTGATENLALLAFVTTVGIYAYRGYAARLV